MKRKNICICLGAWMLLAILAGCGAEEGKETALETPATVETVAEETETEITAALPDVQYDGYTFTYLTAEPYIDHFRLITELNGEPLSDAAFNRNLAVTELLDVTFDGVQVVSDQVAPTLQKAVAAGDTSYDAVFPHASVGVPNMVTGGLLYNLHDLPVVDYSKPWWNQSSVEALSIGDVSYYVSGDICMTWQGMGALLFNKEYLIDYNITENLYDLVREGKWTIDKLLSLVKGVGTDLNGDGEMTADDKFGLLEHDSLGVVYTFSLGQNLTERDENGYPRLAMNTERMVSIVEKYYELVNLPDTWLDTYDSLSYATSTFRDILLEGRSFFTGLDIGGLYSYLREIEFDFGILPYPKYDETQQEYRVNCSAGIVGVPANTPEPERTGAVLEALGWQSYKLLRPAFFDVVLKHKTVRDEDSYDMIELMHESKTFDFATNLDSTGKCASMLTEIVVRKKSTDFSSYYASSEKSINAGFDKIIAEFEKNS